MNFKRPLVVSWPGPAPAEVRLFCIPHAGGGAGAYRDWRKQLPASMDLCALRFPGRESRVMEPPFVAMDELVEHAAPELGQWLDRPFALFGECSGALIAFELTRRLIGDGAPSPRHLIASACRAPQLPLREPPLHGAALPELLAGIAEFGSMKDDVVENPDLLALVEPMLRSDLRLVETWTYTDGPPLPVPILAVAGESDPSVSREEVQAWSAQTSAAFSLLTVPGGHLLAAGAGEALPAAITGALAGITGTDTAPAAAGRRA